jgi:AcrR family transcriptional regulator
LEIAQDLFSEKGYSAVTMKDFCEKSELSRGGLYRHFSSTRDIFTAMLDQDRENSSVELERAILQGTTARQLLLFFIEGQKQEILQGKGRLSVATYEFCTAEPGQKSYLERRFVSAVNTLAKLILYGQSRGEFLNKNAEETARHIIFLLEGIKLSSAVVPLSEEMIHEQLKIIFQMVAGD